MPLHIEPKRHIQMRLCSKTNDRITGDNSPVLSGIRELLYNRYNRRNRPCYSLFLGCWSFLAKFIECEG